MGGAGRKASKLGRVNVALATSWTRGFLDVLYNKYRPGRLSSVGPERAAADWVIQVGGRFRAFGHREEIGSQWALLARVGRSQQGKERHTGQESQQLFRPASWNFKITAPFQIHWDTPKPKRWWTQPYFRLANRQLMPKSLLLYRCRRLRSCV